MKIKKYLAFACSTVLVLAALLNLSFGSVAHASGGTPLYWCHRNSNGDFNTATNWSVNSNCTGGPQLPASGDQLIFDNSPLTSTIQVTDDMASNLTNIGLTFQGNSCDGYVLTASGGNTISLEFGITDTITPTNLSSCSVNQPMTAIASALPLSLQNSQSIDISGGEDSLDISSAVTTGTNSLTLVGNSTNNITLNSLIGSGDLIFNGPNSGTYGYILQTNNSSYSGPVTVANGAAISDQSSDLQGLGTGTITIQSGGALTYYSSQTASTATVSNSFNLAGDGDVVNYGAITLCLSNGCADNSVLNITGNVSLSSATQLGNGLYTGGGSGSTPSVSATYNLTGNVNYNCHALTPVSFSNTIINAPAYSCSSGGSSSSSGSKTTNVKAPNTGEGLIANHSLWVIGGTSLMASALVFIAIALSRKSAKDFKR